SDRDSHYAHRVINLFDGQIVTESQNKPMEATV
ncbi:MAG: ABC transporter ATP-binding protein, partial [Bacteroidota bacterium]